MRRIRSGTLLTVAAVTLLVAGVGVALAAGGPGRGSAPGRMPGPAVMAAATSYIGISPTTLMTERHAGKSLAQIAADHGKTAAGLEAALVQAYGASLDKAVSAGRLTAAQAAQALARFKAHVGAMVEWTPAGPGDGRGGSMMGGGFGGCPWASHAP